MSSSATAQLPEWISELLSAPVRTALADGLRQQRPPLRATALAPAARVLAVSTLARHATRPLLVVTAKDTTARELTAELQATLAEVPDIDVERLPPIDADPYRGMPAHPAVLAERVAVLDRLIRGRVRVLVTPLRGLLIPVPGAEAIAGWSNAIEVGGKLDMDEMARAVVAAGYRVSDVVSSPGDFARRGGLFDIWPPQLDRPIRVELFGDEVESIRRFDATSQRTVDRLTRFRWLPAQEAPIDADTADRLLDKMMGRAREILADAPATEEGIPKLLAEVLAGLEAAPSLHRTDVVDVQSLVPSDLIVWEPEDVERELIDQFEDAKHAHAERDGDAIPGPERLFSSQAALTAALGRAPVAISELPLVDADEARELLELEGRPATHYDGALSRAAADIREAASAGRPVVVLTRTEGRRARMAEVLEEDQVVFDELTGERPWAPGAGEVLLAHGAIHSGVVFGEHGPLVLTEQDLFGADPPPPPPRKRQGGAAFISDLRDLKPGDHVVHVDHGVARFVGLDKRAITGEEMLALEYAGRDKLLVPTSRLDLIQKYSGADQTLVPLDKLGGQSWDRRRKRVRKAVEEIAKDLLELYAKRRSVKAHAFGKDSSWQKEFEQAFPHRLTDDQKRALRDIKADLSSREPMDRLLCGDVGYGKTEVALRAAFKCAQEGYQVAVLVPTTVLSFQHLSTFRARMSAWPIRVEAVSRLTRPEDVKKIIADTASGDVDILIGTHRLLSKDVEFKRLGLLIIDEEQRFGVRHKETIQKMSVGVHVLAMSATPIPRTLQMSLAGVRSLSVIETPPRNRLAIQTHLSPWSPSLIAASIRNELRRGGQVFFIHPRVEGIEHIVQTLRELVPEAEIDHAHGQMPERQLEKTMLQFIRGELQVLVATTIVENGLDISRANTILINQAHRFGLSQLYQMRGRVGRSDQRAYAYLMFPSRHELTADARRRLSALVEFSELGSGFRIAALDLEIRGAGELLGARQSGHIASVGFEMYVQMLEGAVRKLKGQALPEPPEPVNIRMQIESHLPETYVPEAGHRLDIYKRLSKAESLEDVGLIASETEDRFGKLPDAARNLFGLSELRVLASQRGAVSLEWVGDGVAIRLSERPKIDADALIHLVQTDPDVKLSPTGVLKLTGLGTDNRLAGARRALERLSSA